MSVELGRRFSQFCELLIFKFITFLPTSEDLVPIFPILKYFCSRVVILGKLCTESHFVFEKLGYLKTSSLNEKFHQLFTTNYCREIFPIRNITQITLYSVGVYTFLLFHLFMEK